MVRKARRAAVMLRVEALEERALLSVATASWFPDLLAADPDQTLLIRFADTLTPRQTQSIVDRLGADALAVFPSGPTALGFDSQLERDAALARLHNRSWVVYAEADTVLEVETTRISIEPLNANVPYFQELWGLSNQNGVDINAEAAWTVTTGHPNTIVAVIDSGIDLNHPDLASRIWVNPGEIAGNGRDDDGNGYVDDVNGWNFITNTGNVNDDNGHGTHVAGTIAAVGHAGVVGVAPSVTILPLKTLDANGNGSISAAVNAVYYAVDQGARVINASWGSASYSRALDNAIRYAGTPSGNYRGAVFVSAAGNFGTNNDTRPTYPASHRHANTIAVAAVDSVGNLATFSNFGRNTVDLAAPGVGILSTVPGGYAYYSGTSMAAPHVAGVVALLASQYPNLTAADLVQRVVNSTKGLPSLAGRTIRGGIVDAAAALGVGSMPGGDPPANGIPANPPNKVVPPSLPAPTATTDDQIRANLLASDEFFFNNGNTPQGFLFGVYRQVLGRDIDPEGMGTWMGLLDAGVSRHDVALNILASPEAQRTKVASWYLSDLGRATTLADLKSDSGVHFWADQLLNGASELTVRASILGSFEFAQRAGGTTNQFLDALYRKTLIRSLDPGGHATWTLMMRDHGYSHFDVAHAVLASPEGRLSKVARWFRFDLERPQSISVLKADPHVAHWANQLATV